VGRELRAIYRAESAEVAQERVAEFESSAWAKKYPIIGPSWRRQGEQVTPFFNFSPEIRKIIYTTNAIESLNMQLRKVLKTGAIFRAMKRQQN
jgi:putative transposase